MAREIKQKFVERSCNTNNPESTGNLRAMEPETPPKGSPLMWILLLIGFLAVGACASLLSDDPEPYFSNCDEVKAAGILFLREGEPGYRPTLDRDRNGIACE